MIDSTSIRMNDDLNDTEMTIRMYNVFHHQNDFNWSFYEKLQQSNNYLNNFAFPDIKKLIGEDQSAKY